MSNEGGISLPLESVLDGVKKQRNDAFDAVATLNAYIDELQMEIGDLRKQVAKFQAERDTQDNGKQFDVLGSYEDAR